MPRMAKIAKKALVLKRTISELSGPVDSALGIEEQIYR
jgi:hypothetical protein